jgi:hypothetical protein
MDKTTMFIMSQMYHKPWLRQAWLIQPEYVTIESLKPHYIVIKLNSILKSPSQFCFL